MTSVPFAVSTIAQAAAIASLLPAAEAELLERVDATVAERSRVAGALAEIGLADSAVAGQLRLVADRRRHRRRRRAVRCGRGRRPPVCG